MLLEKNLRCGNYHVFDRTKYGNTCPYCHMVVSGNKNTDAIPRAIEELEELLLIEKVDPVVGWVVCYEGVRQGISYNLYSGKNFIGRADDMTVHIVGDSSVARRNHATIAYDPKNRQFTLIPGDSEGMVYLRGKSIYQPTLLSDMDTIQLGNTTLIFRPLCGDNFDWGSVLK